MVLELARSFNPDMGNSDRSLRFVILCSDASSAACLGSLVQVSCVYLVWGRCLIQA